MKRILEKIKALRIFLDTGIWQLQLCSLPKGKAAAVKSLRVILLSLKRFRADSCALRVSSLTFYSLLSIVPVLAMIFGVAKGFGMETVLEKQLLEKMKGQEQALTQIIDFANAMLEKTKGGLIAGVGVLLLFWTVIKVLANVEKAFNDIWQVKKERTLARKFSDYLMFMLICPVLFIMSSSVTVLVSSHVENLIKLVALSGAWSELIMLSLNILPYAVLWFLFSFLYKVMPNTTVKPQSALVAGIVAGTAYQLLQFIYIKFQVGVASYNAIYGSFAALPLFLVWLQVSWSVVLLGAQVSYAYQNIEDYEGFIDDAAMSVNSRKISALAVAHVLVKNFEQGLHPMSARDIAGRLSLPMHLVRAAVHDLISIKAVTCTAEGAYQPACDIDLITIRFITDGIDDKGACFSWPAKNIEVNKAVSQIALIAKAAHDGGANTLLKNI